jgi:Signal transduction histidine kinase involved in nitrogen fixation and metabolism regulation
MNASFVIRITLILSGMLACTSLSVYFFVAKQTEWALFCILLLLLLLLPLYRVLWNNARKIDYFIQAIANDDYTFRFPEAPSWIHTRDLEQQLNRVKLIMQKKRLSIQEQETYYSLLLEKVSSGVILVTHNQHVVQCNAQALKLLHLNVFTHLSQLNNTAPELYTLFSQLRPGQPQKISYTTERESIELLVQTTSISLRQEEYKLLVINDIQKLLEEGEIETWIKLFRVLSHEMMNSINPITSLSDSLLKLYQEEKDPQVLYQDTVNALQIIQETGRRLIDFVGSYHKLLRVPPPKKQNIDIVDFLQGMVMLSSHSEYFSRSRIRVEVASDAPPLCADPNLLGQVVINLIKNALQSIGNDPAPQREDGHILLSYRRDENGAGVLEVTDNGPGVPPEVVPQIFVPFFTTKSEGSGIGLSLARQIMRVHGGSIQLRSHPQQTCFSLHFPLETV